MVGMTENVSLHFSANHMHPLKLFSDALKPRGIFNLVNAIYFGM
jgi:hypothetical protein